MVLSSAYFIDGCIVPKRWLSDTGIDFVGYVAKVKANTSTSAAIVQTGSIYFM